MAAPLQLAETACFILAAWLAVRALARAVKGQPFRRRDAGAALVLVLAGLLLGWARQIIA
ncbi:hypothetical protein [Falsiroseomonas stagni]|uniref:Uncharacterized protein n=1 Tax=Falsiroseomonas stagni DSM 19981 TaxID=1123062 RepID=A0A1I3XB30_9PROT|nr:hypothetical protein [Falsiroseomonas stagni]SFK16764.1 hypothetical protein SAMN02745775_101144 [Falsiroseomonas stagni DSM 19981]